jgi:CheY-like chemotaxis protein
MLTIELIGVLALLLGLLLYAMVRTQLQGRQLSVPGGAGQRARILIVDDDPDFVRITKRVLDNHGFETQTASRGAEALKLMRTSHKPDLVLLDIMMDYITDGLDVSRAMQRDPSLNGIPVIMISSLTGVRSQEIFPSDEHVAESDWLNKPVQPRDLLTAVEGALAGVPAGVPVGVPAVS